MKHIIIIALLFFISIAGLLIFAVNYTNEPEYLDIADNSDVSTFSPFMRDKDNNIVSRKEYETRKALNQLNSGDVEYSVIRTSKNFNQDIPFTLDDKAGVVYKKLYNGRRINICVTGVDSRLGTRYKHADANHVISILIDKGEVEITSVPRDTYADAGMPDTTNQNIIAVLRAKYGRKAYLRRMAQIAELDTIHYYMEFGFSQAMGIIEWLGYDNSKQTLQVLRSRKIFDGGDWQRTYNQGKFMKQAMLKSFNNYGGIFGDLVLMGGLSLVETNLTSGKLSDIIDRLKENGFGQKEDVELRIRPEFKYQFKNFDFNDETTLAQLQSKVDEYSKNKVGANNGSNSDSLVMKTLDKAITKAAVSDSTKKPYITISTLKTFFDQKAWLQISNKKVRHKYREKIKDLLVSAYIQKKEPDNAQKVREIIEQESKLFLHNLNKKDVDYQTLQELAK